MNDPARDRQAELDEQLKRFEERMEADSNPEHRPPFTKTGTVQQAIKAVQQHLDDETKKLKNTRYHMAAQEQAQREKVTDLGWLVEDLNRLLNIIVTSDD